jgi:hypothetical protein
MIKEKGEWCIGSPREPWGHCYEKLKLLERQDIYCDLWLLCKDCLLTRVRLRNHFVNCTLECPFCLQNIEVECHLFFECEGSKEAWNVMDLDHFIFSRLRLFDNMRYLILIFSRLRLFDNMRYLMLMKMT